MVSVACLVCCGGSLSPSSFLPRSLCPVCVRLSLYLKAVYSQSPTVGRWSLFFSFSFFLFISVWMVICIHFLFWRAVFIIVVTRKWSKYCNVYVIFQLVGYFVMLCYVMYEWFVHYCRSEIVQALLITDGFLPYCF